MALTKNKRFEKLENRAANMDQQIHNVRMEQIDQRSGVRTAKLKAQSAERDAAYAKSFALGAKNKAEGAEDSATDAHRRAANLENQVAQLKNAVIQLTDMQQEMDNEAQDNEPCALQLRDLEERAKEYHDRGLHEAATRLEHMIADRIDRECACETAPAEDVKVEPEPAEDGASRNVHALTIVVKNVDEEDLPDPEVVEYWFNRTFFPAHE